MIKYSCDVRTYYGWKTTDYVVASFDSFEEGMSYITKVWLTPGNTSTYKVELIHNDIIQMTMFIH